MHLRIILVVTLLTIVRSLELDAQKESRAVVYGKHDIGLNLLFTIVEYPIVFYDYILNHQSSLGAEMGINLDASDHAKFYIATTYR